MYQKPLKNKNILKIVHIHISNNIPQGNNLKYGKIHIHDDGHQKDIIANKTKETKL